MDRHNLRYAIENTIDTWRDGDHTAEPGSLHLYDPNEVKELARAIRDDLEKLLNRNIWYRYNFATERWEGTARDEDAQAVPPP